MPYKTVKQSCTRSDGKKGKYVLKYKPQKKTSKKKDSQGYVKAGCHTSKKGASAQRAAIEGPRESDASVDEMIAEYDEAKSWSKKRKASVDCSNPKGFSEKAHCAGKKKKKNESIRRRSMNLRKTIRKIILETSCGMCTAGAVEDEIIEPVYDMIVATDYPEVHTHESGRMFDYGHTKSDSHEGRMTRAKLYRMGKMAQSFHDRIEDGDDLPEWVQDKVTTAEDRLRSAFEYIDYKIHRLKLQGKPCNETVIRNIARQYLRG